jgi:sulfur-oxidizing protein SoxX
MKATSMLVAWMLSGAAHAADGIPDPLPGTAPGDIERGRAVVANRQLGLCLLCHSGPIPEEPFQGNLAPDLAGAGERATAAQLRQRIVDPARIHPATIMPAYFKADGLAQVAPQYRGKTILTAQQVEDVVAYLQTLRTLFAQPPAPQAPVPKDKP